MTEADWLAEVLRPKVMLQELAQRGLYRRKSGRRRLRLFACGSCRVAWDAIPDEQLRQFVTLAERFVDGFATNADMETARDSIRVLASDSGPYGRAASATRVAVDMAIATVTKQPFSAAYAMVTTSEPLAGWSSASCADAYLCDLLRDIFGNPFRPVAFDPGWLTPTVVALANGIYAERAFDRMPILADALEEAGCDNADVLLHCRGDGPHVRGCWVVDAVLGKE